MAALDFPSSPVNGQTYSLNGAYYTYNSTLGAWVTTTITNPYDSSSDTQIIFKDGSTANGSPGATFNKSSNTSYFNNIAVTQNVSATYFKGNGSLLTGIITDLAAANAYATSVGTSGNAYTDTVVVANLNIANAYSRVFANSVGTAGNANLSVATVAANTYAASVGVVANAYTDTVVIANLTIANAYSRVFANSVGAASNTWANSKVDTITSNSTSRIWANSVTVSGIETVYIDLSTSGVTATTYGASDTTVPYFTVDAYGRITAAGNTTVANAKTMLQNTTVTLAGALTTTGQMYANAQLTVNPTDGTQEGGQVDLKGAAAYPTWSIDSYQNSLRFFNANTGYQSVYIYNSSTGTINVGINRSTSSYAVDVVGTVNASALLVNGVAVGGGSSMTANVIGASATAVKSNHYIATTFLTLTLPATPTVGDQVGFQNSSGFSNCSIARNGSNIMSLAEDMKVDRLYIPFTLIYADATRGWVFV